MAKKSGLVVWFNEVDKDDVALVGGKGANLGEMIQNGFAVPDGFIVTAKAYFDFIKANNLTTKINHLLRTVNYDRQDSLNQVSSHIKKLIIEGQISDELKKEVFMAYRRLGGVFKDALVAVRSSATAEDLPHASFAGQQQTFLNVKGEANLIQKIREAWASLFEPRAIFYRHEQEFDHFRVGIAVPVQKMIESEKSGVIFTIDPVTNDKSRIIIEAIYGLGELIVQGKVTPDHYEVDKTHLEILNKQINPQKILLKKVGTKNKEIKISEKEGKRQKITDKQILELASLGKKLEKHYYFPQDAEWAIEKKKIYLVQTRPVTTTNQKSKIKDQKDNYTLDPKRYTLLLKGDPASPGIASGPARIILSAKEINKVVSGDVLVTPQTNPDYVPAMKKAVAIIAEKGGRTSHAAIVSRELGIPAVVGAENATKILKTEHLITVNGLKGEIYKGGHFFPTLYSLSTPPLLKTATKVYVNLGEPELADKVAKQNPDGVGLLRAEFMMAEIGVHPKKMIQDHKKHLYIKTLTQGLESFCRAFYPKPVVYRTSDFKTNEYRNLIGGKDFEPQEPNPLLGYRGAFRYLNDPKVFELELEAIKYVRNKREYKNLWVMIPFVRTVKELISVKKMFTETGLHRSETFKLWIMVEIPSNVILLDKFIEVGLDGVSIGSNDLTMLLLGTDRDNSEVARAFDERDETVLWALEQVIKTCHKHKITSSICGQAPSMYPDLVEKLVKWGITSVSVSPDAIDTTRKMIYEQEKKLII